MDSTRGVSQKDIWDKISASSGVIAAILVPVAVAFVGAQYSSALKERELDLSSKREYIQIGLSILRDPSTSNNIRRWGTDIINHYADVKMNDDALKAFSSNGQILPSLNEPSLISPPPGATASFPAGESGAAPSNASNNAPPLSFTGRVAQMDVLQTQGINSLLDHNLDAAVQAYSSAYDLWPTFRSVDEIKKLLNSRLKSSPPHSDEEWKRLYQQIARFDLRGVDQKTKDRLAKESS